jgi:hypothetical protein
LSLLLHSGIVFSDDDDDGRFSFPLRTSATIEMQIRFFLPPHYGRRGKYHPHDTQEAKPQGVACMIVDTRAFPSNVCRDR